MKRSRKFRESFECREIRFRAERAEIALTRDRISPYIREMFMEFKRKEESRLEMN